MVQANTLPSDRAAIVAVMDPDVTAAGTVETGWVSAADFERFMAIIMAGTLGSGASLDAKIEQATDDTGTDAKDVTGKAITQMTQAGTNQSDTQAIINLNVDELDIANAFTHIRLSVTVAGATSDAAALLLGFDARELPASVSDAASVGEIV